MNIINLRYNKTIGAEFGAAQWLALLPHSARDPGSIPASGHWSLYILPVSAWVSSGCSGFLPQSKDVRWIGHAKLTLVSGGLARVMGIGPGWDCGRCRLDGPNAGFYENMGTINFEQILETLTLLKGCSQQWVWDIWRIYWMLDWVSHRSSSEQAWWAEWPFIILDFCFVCFDSAGLLALIIQKLFFMVQINRPVGEEWAACVGMGSGMLQMG